MSKYLCSYCNSNITEVIPNISNPEYKDDIVRCYECNMLSFYGDDND